MRVFLLVILTLIPTISVAVTDEYCAQFSENQNTCKNAAGCQYEPNQTPKCRACQEGYFCAENSNPEACGNEFNLSLTGSTSQNDCYKYIGGTTETNHCEKQNGESILTCGLFYDSNNADGVPKCWDPSTGAYDDNYHTEGNGTNIKCYSNIRNCELFDNSGCDDAVSGRLKWSLDEYWTSTGANSTYNCECEKTGILHNSCIANVTYSLTGIAPDNDTEQATITFGTTPSSYECKKCPAGTYLTPSDFTPNPQCTGGGVACSCTDVEQGYYSTECTINGTSSCQQTPCPKPGQTTNGSGAGTSVNACHYSSETKFCDATGCFTISDAGDDTWNWSY